MPTTTVASISVPLANPCWPAMGSSVSGESVSHAETHFTTPRSDCHAVFVLPDGALFHCMASPVDLDALNADKVRQ